MSRIDQALKIREGSSGTAVSEVEAIDSGQPSLLGHYPQEEGVAPPPAQLHSVAESRSAEPEQPFRPNAVARRAGARRRMALNDGDLQARLVTSSQSTASREQYRRLAAALHEEQRQGQLKTVMITSALPDEGKTLTVVNLALTLSESYSRRVLVIDADLRMPSVHAVFGIPNERGLTEALRDPQQPLPFVTCSETLSVLTAGKPGATPLAGLTSDRMRELLAECAARFDWVLIDTSPIGVLPDAQVLAGLIGAVLFVVGAGSTPAAAVERAVAELGGPDSIVGVVLNRVEERRIPESYYYDQYQR